MTESKIEWTGRSDWNPIRGCTRVSEGCRHCYAEQIAGRFSGPDQPFEGFARQTSDGGRWTGKVAIVEDRLTLPLRWRKPATIFASSTSDIFHENLSDGDIDRIFAVMALTPQHTYQVLTKRAERMRAYVTTFEEKPDSFGAALASVVRAAGLSRDAGISCIDTMHWPLPNLWLGVSAEDQATANARIPQLMATPAAKRFLSCEPLLGPIDLECAWHGESALDSECWGDCNWCRQGPDFPPLWNCQRAGGERYELGAEWCSGVDWVIAGGESGRGARPMDGEWARTLRDQCAGAKVPFFFKQHGEWIDVRDLRRLPGGEGPGFGAFDHLPYNEEAEAVRVGKSRAGRLLDGVEHDGMPA